MTSVLRQLTPDTRLLFATRIARLFGYGLLSVVLVLYLAQVGLTDAQIGLLLTLTLLGDTVVSLWLTTTADRVGRRKTLLIGAGLMLLAGVVFALTRNPLLLLIAATVGVISPSGNEVGPFLSVEQAAMSQAIPAAQRTHVFAWYNLAGSFATALGALCGGFLAQAMQHAGWTPLASYRVVIMGYALIGVVLAGLFARVSTVVEVPARQKYGSSPSPSTGRLGLGRSQGIVLRLAALFALDAFGGGLVMQSVVAYWFAIRFHTPPAVLGSIFFGANLLAGVSALLAGRIAARFGLINTMVFTHLPSNILLILVPLMPTAPLAIAVLLLRFSISQMDVPTRQAYTMAVVRPEERSAAAGVTGTARSLGAATSPLLVGMLLGNPALWTVPFFLSGGVKIVYDLLLYRRFQSLPPSMID